MSAPQRQSRVPIERLLSPLQRFIQAEASGGIVLMLCTVIALVWANSPWGEQYIDLWSTYVGVDLSFVEIRKPLLQWVNDGLMAIFFLVVGLEIKRELLVGELASPRRAIVPIVAAVGGMVGPAALYLLFNPGGPGARGWGVPMATDIAFAVGVLVLLGRRVPVSLKVFLTALAIVDDLGAVTVIALFYTESMTWSALGVAGATGVGLIVMNLLGVRRPLPYALLGVVLWVAVLKSGVHATIAGVALAMTIPATVRIGGMEFAGTVPPLLERIRLRAASGASMITDQELQSAVHEVEVACEQVQPPLLRLEHALVPWVAYLIMPVFALANAGVRIGEGLQEALVDPICYGIAIALFAGKQVGITGFTWLAVRLRLGSLPAGVNWAQIYGASCLAGIGFTMSLFIAGLAFPEEALLNVAKIGILLGSLASGLLGAAILARAGRTRIAATS